MVIRLVPRVYGILRQCSRFPVPGGRAPEVLPIHLWQQIDTNLDVRTMSALGQKQTCAVQNGMSALPPKATLNATSEKPPLGHFRKRDIAG